jgi:hypothetical protein
MTTLVSFYCVLGVVGKFNEYHTMVIDPSKRRKEEKFEVGVSYFLWVYLCEEPLLSRGVRRWKGVGNSSMFHKTKIAPNTISHAGARKTSVCILWQHRTWRGPNNFPGWDIHPYMLNYPTLTIPPPHPKYSLNNRP